MFIVYDSTTGENIGPFPTAEDAVDFIEYVEKSSFNTYKLELQEVSTPQQYVLDNDLDEVRV